MRRITLALLLLFPAISNAQGKFATGDIKKLVGRIFTENGDPGLRGFQFNEGSMISPLKDPHRIVANVYKKGSTVIVLVSLLKDSVKKLYQILDVLEIKNVQKGWEVRTALCRQDQQDDAEIVALAKQSKEDFLTGIQKAWRFNRQKRYFESLAVRGIDCFNEGDD